MEIDRYYETLFYIILLPHVDDYIYHDERHQSRTRRVDMDAGEGSKRWGWTCRGSRRLLRELNY